jgi:hypothetical protein
VIDCFALRDVAGHLGKLKAQLFQSAAGLHDLAFGLVQVRTTFRMLRVKAVALLIEGAQIMGLPEVLEPLFRAGQLIFKHAGLFLVKGGYFGVFVISEERADGHHADGGQEKNQDLELALEKDIQEISGEGPVGKLAVHGLPFQSVDDDTFLKALAGPVLTIMSKGKDLSLKNGHTPSPGSLSTVCITTCNTICACEHVETPQRTLALPPRLFMPTGVICPSGASQSNF